MFDRNFVLAALSVLGTYLALAAAWGLSWCEFLDALWPVGVIVLVGLLVAYLAVRAVVRRARTPRAPAAEDRPAPEGPDDDQRLVDDTLALLNRRAVRMIDDYDFAEPWLRRIMYPVMIYMHEMGDFEHRFNNDKLETARVRLRETGEAFLSAEASNGWAFPRDTRYRYVGLVGGEVEGDPEKEARFDQRSTTIHDAARAFTQAHENFLKTVREQRFSFEAVRSEYPHPRVQEMLNILEPAD